MVRRTHQLGQLMDLIQERIPRSQDGRALLVAISGIDGSGKGTVAARLATGLEDAGRTVARIGLDPWHQPSSVRFSDSDPAAHFYRHAFRFEELLQGLVDPLPRDGSVDLDVPLVDPASDRWYREPYHFKAVDVILLEGIFLLARERRARYDLSIWVHCPFGLALERALARNQERKPLDQLREDYERVYFPAQRFHLEQDDPEAFADLIFVNG